MDCGELRGSIYGYVERRLSAEVRVDFERHLEACPPCKELVGHVLALPCRDFVQFLDDYFEHRLAPEVRREFEKHMELCPPCLDYLRSYERTVELGREACSSELPVPEALVRAILAARRAERN